MGLESHLPQEVRQAIHGIHPARLTPLQFGLDCVDRLLRDDRAEVGIGEKVGQQPLIEFEGGRLLAQRVVRLVHED